MQASKDLLTGTPKSGAFGFDPKVSFSSSTSSGVSFAVNAIKKGDKVDPTLKVWLGWKRLWWLLPTVEKLSYWACMIS